MSLSENDLHTFFQLIGRNLKARGNGRYMTNCPFPENHKHGDKAMSFSVVMGNPPGFKCFGCGIHGSLNKLARMYNETTGDTSPLNFVRSFLDDTDVFKRTKNIGSFEKERARKIGRWFKTVEHIKKPIDEEKLKEFLTQIPEYAIERGLGKKEIIDWEIGYDRYEDRMIFPVRGISGTLYGVSGRDLTGESKIKYRHYTGLSREAVLYGEKFLNPRNPTAYIVEGFFDAILLRKNGLENVFATMGTSLSAHHIKILTRYFKEVIFIPDGVDTILAPNGDEILGYGAGLKFAEEYAKVLFMQKIKSGIAGVIYNPEYERRIRPTKWSISDYRYEIVKPLLDKDPSDLSKDEIKEVLSKVKYFEVKDL